MDKFLCFNPVGTGAEGQPMLHIVVAVSGLEEDELADARRRSPTAEKIRRFMHENDGAAPESQAQACNSPFIFLEEPLDCCYIYTRIIGINRHIDRILERISSCDKYEYLVSLLAMLEMEISLDCEFGCWEDENGGEEEKLVVITQRRWAEDGETDEGEEEAFMS